MIAQRQFGGLPERQAWLHDHTVDPLFPHGREVGAEIMILRDHDRHQLDAEALTGDLDLLYLAPERLLTERCLDLLASVPLSLFAIDEAHCVSQWGHDFRPEYIQLSVLARRFAGVPRVALTATADGLVAAGYASRATEPGDRRVVRLSLTPAGRAALDRADAAYSAWLGPLLDATGGRQTVLDALELLGSAMTEARRARQGLAPRDDADSDGDGKERAHEHRTEHHHDHAAQREGGG